MNTPKDLRYTKTHEWVRMSGKIAVVGITDFAQHQLSDLTYVELPTAGDQVTAQEEVAVVESVKAASDIYAPISGIVKDVNSALLERPEIINQDPYGDGWMFKLQPDDSSEFDMLLDAEQYEELLPEPED
mgnify:CR=1 FL=1